MKSNKTTPGQCKDSGLAIVLILLLLLLGLGDRLYLVSAIITLVVVMTYPPVFKPFAYLWFKFSELLGSVVSTILLSILFVVLVLPVGIVRRILGKDSMLTKKWKSDKSSVFTERSHVFSSKDLSAPF